MKRRFAFFALLFTLFCIAPAFAREIHFQTLGGVEGLSQSSAISIWQDNIGRMWLGNDAVNCYDGETVRVFRLSEYFPSIEDSNIHTITGNDSVMFVISESQLLCFDLHTEAFYMPDIQLTTIYCRGDDVFYASERTIYRYDWKKKNSHPLVTLPADVLGVRKIFSLPDGRLLLATPIGLFVVDASSGEIISHVLEDEDITALLVDSRNNILLSARSGKLYISSVNTSYPWSFSLLHHGDQCLAHTNVYCMAEDVSGSVWLGTLSGLYQLQRKNTNALEEDQLTVVNHVVPESTIYSLYSDRQGSLWIGSYYGDVRYFNPLINNYIYYKTDEEHPDRLHGAVIGDIVEDHSDNLYVTTEGSGMNILFAGQDKFRHLTTANGLHQNKLRCSWFDEEYNRLYLSEYMHGLSYYDLTAQKVYPLSNDTALSSPYARIIESIHPYKNFLILRTQRGLFKMHRHTLEISPLFKRNPELQELCSGIIRAVHVDERDILWVSSFTRGLFTIDIKSRKVLKYYGDGILPESVIPSAIVSMCEDSRKGLFLCTLKSGLLAYNPEDDSFTSFTEAAHELVSDICYKSVFSWYGNLIVTTNKGISILNLSSRKKLNSAYHIRLSSSYPLTALSGDCGLYASKRRDRIYVGGLYGLLIFSEKELGAASDDYTLYFSSIRVNNESLNAPTCLLPQSLSHTDRIVFPHNKNTLSLAFASSNYLSTHSVIHEYTLEGLDEYWTAIDHKNIVLHSLRPGKYKLRVREVDNPEKEAVLAIEIKPPFWATPLAILLYILLALFAFWWIMRFTRSKAILKTSLESERKEIMRIEEANRNKMDFFINISNEFRTPVTLILSQLDRLSYELPTAGQKRLEKMKRQAIRLQDLINELLDFRKIEQNKLLLHVERNDMNSFIKGIFSTYVEYAEEKHIRYRLNRWSGDLFVWFDRKQMQKVIYNLLSFLFRFASEKNSVTISINQQNKRAEVIIECTGDFRSNMPMEYLFTMINEENSVNPDLAQLPEGGMGLLYSKGIVQLHKGTFVIEREEGRLVFLLSIGLGNAHFSEKELQYLGDPIEKESMTMPLALEDSDLIFENDDEVESDGQRLKLLLVESDKEVRSLIKEAFAFLYDVTELTDTEKAYQYAIDEQPDVIITEANMQGMSGLEMCGMLKTNIQTLHIPVLVISLDPSEKLKIESIRSGADEYIVKPFNLQLLVLRCNYLVKYRQKMLQNANPAQSDAEMIEGATNIQDRDFIEMSNQILEDNWSNPAFGTTFWSKQLGIGRTRLFSRIKDITGMTPNEYILHMKMAKATLLLKETTLTISEIAYQLGFSIPAYFSKCFKKQFGVTPADYRKGGLK